MLQFWYIFHSFIVLSLLNVNSCRIVFAKIVVLAVSARSFSFSYQNKVAYIDTRYFSLFVLRFWSFFYSTTVQCSNKTIILCAFAFFYCCGIVIFLSFVKYLYNMNIIRMIDKEKKLDLKPFLEVLDKYLIAFVT